VIVALCLLTLSHEAAAYRYNIVQVHNPADNSSIWIRAPENNSKVGENNTLTITVSLYNTKALYVSAWGQYYPLTNNTMMDLNLFVKAGDNVIYFTSENRLIYEIHYVVVQDTQLPTNPDWEEYVRQQQELERQRLAAANAPPTSWLWSKTISAVLTIVLMVFFGSLCFVLTRITKLIEIGNPLNGVMMGAALAAFLIALIWMFIDTWGGSAKENLISFAMFALLCIFIIGSLAGWWGGFIGARFSMRVHKFWIVDQKAKRIREYIGVIYDNDKGNLCWAIQEWSYAWRRWWSNIHYSLHKLHDRGCVREDWKLDSEMGSEGVQPISSMDIRDDLKTVLIDSTASVARTVYDKKSKKLMVFENDFSSFAHVLQCNASVTTDSEWILHCNAFEKLRAEYYQYYEENIILGQAIYVGKNSEMKQHREQLDKVMLDLEDGNEYRDPRDQEAEVEAVQGPPIPAGLPASSLKEIREKREEQDKKNKPGDAQT
jgi:hypothetical protein